MSYVESGVKVGGVHEEAEVEVYLRLHAPTYKFFRNNELYLKLWRIRSDPQIADIHKILISFADLTPNFQIFEHQGPDINHTWKTTKWALEEPIT